MTTLFETEKLEKVQKERLRYGSDWSKADCKKLAEESGDILELEVTVTVHTKVNTSSGGEWTR